MPLLPIVLGSDDRRKKGVTLKRLRNCLVEPIPADLGKGRYAIIPRPGLRPFATLSGAARGLFAQAGVQGSGLFGVGGAALSEVSAIGAVTSVGAVAGTDNAGFGGLRSKLVVRAGGKLYVKDGASFDVVTDVDAPTDAQTLAISGGRVVAGNSVDDLWGWSKAGDPLDWDPNGQAADFDQPDPLLAQIDIGGDLMNLNSTTVQRWRATGGPEAQAFAPVSGSTIYRGILGRDTLTRIGAGSAAFIGDDFSAYRISVGGLEAVPNRDLADILKALTPAQRALTLSWSYTDGDRDVWVVRAQGSERAFVHDFLTGVWSEWTRYGRAQFDLGFAAQAYAGTFAASPSSADVYRLDEAAFDDLGDPIERIMTVVLQPGRDAPIDEVALDLAVLDQPLIGQGSAPKAMIAASYDGGFTFDAAREVNLPPRGQYRTRMSLWGFGQVNREHGLTLEIRITDPVRFACYGAWINPTAEEALR